MELSTAFREACLAMGLERPLVILFSAARMSHNAEVFFTTPAPRRKVFVGFVCACACMCYLSVLEMSF